MKKPIVIPAMRPWILSALLTLFLLSCKESRKKPDVSGITINLVTQRFEQDLFAIDTNQVGPSLQALSQKYPAFLPDFLQNILGLPPGDSQTAFILRKFLAEFRPVQSEADRKFRDFSLYEKEVVQMLKYTRFYFPEYQLPKKLISFVGPMDAFYEASLGWSGDIITSEGLGVGLQMHLGGNSPLYSQEGGQGYPQYISRRFEPEYIAVNCARNVIDDIYPDKTRSSTLIEQMVDKGKRLYVLDRLLPDAPDSLKIGYTANQLSGCYKNEGMIWNLFTQNNLLFETDYQKIKTFVGDGPKTEELGDESPGYIALFTGWQIVKAYMDKYPETSLPALLKLDNKKVFEGSKYKPK